MRSGEILIKKEQIVSNLESIVNILTKQIEGDYYSTIDEHRVFRDKFQICIDVLEKL